MDPVAILAKNPLSKAALQYTGRLEIKYMVHAWQLRAEHPDYHYAAALFCYLQEMASMYCEHATLLLLDDKHRCKVSEPQHPVAAVEHGKEVLASLHHKWQSQIMTSQKPVSFQVLQ